MWDLKYSMSIRNWRIRIFFIFVAALFVLKPITLFFSPLALDHAVTGNVFIMLLLLQLNSPLLSIIRSSRVVVLAAKGAVVVLIEGADEIVDFYSFGLCRASKRKDVVVFVFIDTLFTLRRACPSRSSWGSR
jgi:hypothetical protein